VCVCVCHCDAVRHDVRVCLPAMTTLCCVVQFDTLRRAKHSSMMILWHLHNPQYPAFAHICNVCDEDIGSDVRYHCELCEDFDMCSSCHRTATHEHPPVSRRGYERE
jgi:hypothetical protein